MKRAFGIASLAMSVVAWALASGGAPAPGGAVASAGVLPSQSRVPGGVALLGLPDDAAANAVLPIATYDGKRVLVWKTANHWIAIVGIPLSAAPGPATLTVQRA